MSNTLVNTVDWAELKELYIDATDGKAVCRLSNNNSQMNKFVESWKTTSTFYGPNTATVLGWLHNGYHQPGLTLDPPIDPIRKKRRLRLGEEGDLQYDLALSGHDYPFLQWDSREVMPGMKVMIINSFVASTPITIINNYNRWILRALVALESSGIDLEVNMMYEGIGVYQNSGDTIVQFLARVKKEGENSDLLAWSPMLSPASFRHLGFCHFVYGCDQLGKNVAYHLGRGTNTSLKWGVKFNPETRELRFNCPFTPRDFPEDEMEIQLRDVLNQSRRAA